jgi:hypothetical protein
MDGTGDGENILPDGGHLYLQDRGPCSLGECHHCSKKSMLLSCLGIGYFLLDYCTLSVTLVVCCKLPAVAMMVMV